MEPTDWLLRPQERGNPFTGIDRDNPGGEAWTTGNRVRPLVHGAVYFAELAERLRDTRAGDRVYFSDWRGDPDERLTGMPGSEVGVLLGDADERGVDVRGLVWRSHWDKLSFSAEENRHLGHELQDQGAEVLLDMRVRSGGSHHQKFVVIRHRDDPSRDIAYVGGIDLCHSRRDDRDHGGDPQPQSMAAVYGPTPPWHDVQVAIEGPAVRDVESVFRERWEDPAPLSRNPFYRLQDRLQGMDVSPDPLGEQWPAPPPVPDGPHTVQLLRTYPRLRRTRSYPYAPQGERSVARGYTKALDKARHLVYIEDQYLWSQDVGDTFVERLRANPDLHVIAVLPHFPDQDSPMSKVPQLLGRYRAMERMREAAPDRFAVYGIENHAGTPVYVHAKVCVMDDWWATVGSDNFNRRSWTHDSELSCVVMDPTGGDHSPYARSLRLELAAEHLDRDPGDVTDLVDLRTMFEAYAASAAALQAWYDGGKVGPRPPGRLRPLSPPDLGPVTRRLAEVPYRLVHDPDGRPKGLKRTGRY